MEVLKRVTRSTRKFRIPLSELCLFTNNVINLINDDLPSFQRYGVTQQELDSLTIQNNEVQNMEQDELYHSEMSYAIEIKNNIRRTCEQILREINFIGKYSFGESAAKTHSVYIDDLTKLSEAQFLKDSKIILSAATKELVKMSDYGLTQELLDSLEQEIDNYENAIDSVAMKKMQREEATELRIDASNKLFDNVKRLCDFGKLIYYHTSAARYNNFVLYPSSVSPVSAPTNFSSALGSRIVSWAEVENATSYRLETSRDGVNFNEAYSGIEPFAELELEQGLNFIRTQARNQNGYGPISDVFEKYYGYRKLG